MNTRKSAKPVRQPLPDNLGKAALESWQAMKRGEAAPRVHTATPGPADIAALRARLGLTQAEFAARYAVSVDSLRSWEQGRRAPEGAAKTLLSLIATAPEVIADLVRQAGAGGDAHA